MPFRECIRLESSGGLVLMAAAATALLLDNSSLAWLYDRLLGMFLAITIGEFGLKKPLLLWINDGLMAIFFLLEGLEIKREVLIGEPLRRVWPSRWGSPTDPRGPAGRKFTALLYYPVSDSR